MSTSSDPASAHDGPDEQRQLHDLVMAVWAELPSATRTGGRALSSARPLSQIVNCDYCQEFDDRTCTGYDLPTLLSKVQDRLGRPFLPEDGRAQLEAFAQSAPDAVYCMSAPCSTSLTLQTRIRSSRR